MLISALFPLITLIIYTVVPNLLTPYSRLMRHFTVSIMLAFICMAIVQLATNLNEDSPEFCTFLGNMAINIGCGDSSSWKLMKFHIFQDLLHNFSFWLNSPSWASWVLKLWCKSGKFIETKCYMIGLVHLHFYSMKSLQSG